MTGLAARPRRDVGATIPALVCFSVLGLAGATWSSRLPQVYDHLGLTSPQLGLLLISVALGGVLVLPFSGRLVGTFGVRRCMVGLSVTLAASMTALAVGYVASESVLVAGLFGLGATTGLWDVVMTVVAAALEQRLGRPLLPRFYAAFSVGTIAGAGVGVLAVGARIPVPVHFAAVAAVVCTAVPAAAHHFPRRQTPPPTGARSGGLGPGVRPWREPRTAALGLLVLAFAVAEGGGSSWISVTTVQVRHASPTTGSVAYAVFLTALTTARLLGSWGVARWGRVRVLRGAIVSAVAGIVGFAVAADQTVAFVAILCWGLGAALGFPIGLSAAAEDPDHSTGRISAVTGLGYLGFLAGPPVIGAAAALLGTADGLVVIAVLLTVVLPLANSVRTTRPAPPGRQAVDSESSSP